MKLFFSTILVLSLQSLVYAQHGRIAPEDYKLMQQKEDSMKGEALKIIQGEKSMERFNADSTFTRLFMRALKTKNSFDYPFDSLFTISKLYAPDSSFRIFTWQMIINENVVRQHGAIQRRTPDGSLNRFPLIDKSDVTTDMDDSIGNNFGWMGAVYYKILLTKNQQGHPYYTLLGYDENNFRSNKKIIEVLDFQNNEPVFGGNYFSIAGGGLQPKNPARYIMEYKSEAGPRLTYDESLGMIVMEHLVSESNEPAKKSTLVGDGDYEGFKWSNGKWVYVDKIFNQVTPEGNAPVPKPLSPDADKTINKSKLLEEETGKGKTKPPF